MFRSAGWKAAHAGLVRWLRSRARVPVAAAVFGAELLLVATAFIVNVRLFSGMLGEAWAASVESAFLLIVLALRGTALVALSIYKRSILYPSTADMIAMAKAVGLSGMAWYLLAKAVHFPPEIPGVFVISDAVGSFLLLSALHFAAPIYKFYRARKAEVAKKVIVIGEGDAGATVVNELICDPFSGIRPVGIIDDDPEKRGIRIGGVPVVGDLSSLRESVVRLDASEVLVCIPSATESQMRHILSVCRQCGVPIRTLPSVSDLVTDRVSSRDLRNLRIEDVLQRKQAAVDASFSKELIRDKTVLVTGAGGSIGSELSRQVAAAGPRRLILLDRSENNLFYSHMGVQEGWPSVSVNPVLADILDEESLNELFREEKPELVFHAAAFKHVGMMERHPYQAIRNNVLGTWNLLMAAVRGKVPTFVNISTDKAVNPCNYMGLSKKLAERLVRAVALRHQAAFMNVRFGNVAGSSGSVLQIFGEQIKKGGPLCVTDPQATRYFMSIGEAVYLVLCAARLGRGGETFILDMGDPVNIYELARAVSLLSGLTPEEELPIQFTGLRQGEKFQEELWESWEQPQATGHPQIFALTGTDPAEMDALSMMQELQRLIRENDRQGVLAYVRAIAPEFSFQQVPVTA